MEGIYAAMREVRTLNASTTASRFGPSAEKSTACGLPAQIPVSQSGSLVHESINDFQKPVYDRHQILFNSDTIVDTTYLV